MASTGLCHAVSGVDVGRRDGADAAGRRCVRPEAGSGPLGTARLRGMASHGEAERLLGVSRLRKVRAVVRPDLYGKNQDQ
jgi:hypothetical protein